MSKRDNDHENLLLSIETVADEVASELGSECVKEVFAMYGAKGVNDIAPDVCESVFSELQRLASDI